MDTYVFDYVFLFPSAFEIGVFGWNWRLSSFLPLCCSFTPLILAGRIQSCFSMCIILDSL